MDVIMEFGVRIKRLSSTKTIKHSWFGLAFIWYFAAAVLLLGTKNVTKLQSDDMTDPGQHLYQDRICTKLYSVFHLLCQYTITFKFCEIFFLNISIIH